MDNKKVIQTAIEFAKPYYDSPHRVKGYHSWNHIQEGFSLFQKHFKEDVSDYCEFIFYISWIFHDIVYIGSSNHNEEDSDEMFKIFCAIYPDLIKKQTQQYISEFILCTKQHRPARVSDEDIRETSKILNDIDLAYLGYDFVNFMRKRAAVRNDYIMYNDREFNQGSSLFCHQFLTQDFIYFTDKFQKTFENNAFSNLDRYLKVVQS